ncbi:MAG: hypothetical protein SGBAC_009013 [Bacillariaceae sp.]
MIFKQTKPNQTKPKPKPKHHLPNPVTNIIMATKSPKETLRQNKRGKLRSQDDLDDDVAEHNNKTPEQETPMSRITSRTRGIHEDALRIRILFSDADIVVLSKPPNLRSVPGHAVEATTPATTPTATETTMSKSKKRKRTMSAQEAWMAAIRSFPLDLDAAADNNNNKSKSNNNNYYKNNHSENKNTKDDTNNIINSQKLLSRLAASVVSPGANVPRNYKKFASYMERNKRRIFNLNNHDDNDDGDDDNETTIMVRNNNNKNMKQSIDEMFGCIEQRQRRLWNRHLPKRTALKDSALGQLELLGFGTASQKVDLSLFAIHRLDCATSGVMVFGRNQLCASRLSRSWRNKREENGNTLIRKTYLCKVQEWPPWSNEHKKEGFINLPLSPSANERLKWRVDEETGKPSKTRWEVLSKDKNRDESPILLQLTPYTGRTHQLRIHCAAIGSGIIGDSLYGRDAEKNPAPGEPSSLLYLHAYSLSFPHPTTNALEYYSIKPDWCSEAELEPISDWRCEDDMAG